MNTQIRRRIIAIVLMAVHLLGVAAPAVTRVAVAEAPACQMACCVPGVCECQALPDDSQQPTPVAPAAQRLEMKFVTALMASLPAPNASARTTVVLAPEAGSACKAAAPRLFQMHCALLM